MESLACLREVNRKPDGFTCCKNNFSQVTQNCVLYKCLSDVLNKLNRRGLLGIIRDMVLGSQISEVKVIQFALACLSSVSQTP